MAISVTRWPYLTRSVGIGVGRLTVQDGDQIWHRREHFALLQHREVLVLNLNAEESAGVITKAFYNNRAADEALRSAALDVGYLAAHQGKAPGRSATRAAIESPTALVSASPILIASVNVPRTVAPRACRTVIVYSVAAPAPPNSTAAERSKPLHPFAGDRVEYKDVATLVSHDTGVRIDPGQVHGDLRDQRERPAHSVSVDDWQAHPPGPAQWEQTVGSADLRGHKCGYRPASEALEVLAQDVAFTAVLDLLDVHGRRADHPAWHDQRVVREIVEVDELGRPDLLQRLESKQQPDPRIATAAGAEDRAAAG